MIKLFSLFLVIACSSGIKNTKNSDQKQTYNYVDASGNYHLVRENKRKGNRIITRSTIYDKNNSPLESSITVSKIGSVNKKVAVLPDSSQFYVWFNKKQYKTKIRLLNTKRKVWGQIIDPDKGTREYSHDLKKGRYFCFFSQLPECIEQQNILLESRNKKVFIYIVWDNYPFNLEQYEQIPESVVSLSQFSFSKKEKNSLVFELDIGNQVILLHFDRQLKFEKMFWIAQAISITKQG